MYSLPVSQQSNADRVARKSSSNPNRRKRGWFSSFFKLNYFRKSIGAINESVSLSGNDVVKINERILADFASDDIALLTFPNELAALKTGKNGNTIYASNETGKQAELVLKVIRGSSDDKYLSNLLNFQKLNFANFVLMTGEMIKRIGDGTGKIISDTYILSGGIF